MIFGHVTDRLAPYVDGALDPRETARVAGHLLGCRRCRRRLDRVRVGARLASALVVRERPARHDAGPRWDELEALMGPAAGERSPGRVPTISTVRAGWGWAAAAAALVLVGGGLVARVAPAEPHATSGLERQALEAHAEAKLDLASADPGALAAFVGAGLGKALTLQPAPQMHLRGALRLAGGAAAVRGEIDGLPVTLAVMDGPTGSAGKRVRQRREGDWNVLTWSAEGRSYAVVSAASGARACTFCHAVGDAALASFASVSL